MSSLGLRYLVLKKNVYWFKRDIPAALRGGLDGKTAYLRNLQTSDVKTAKQRRDETAAEVDTDRKLPVTVVSDREVLIKGMTLWLWKWSFGLASDQPLKQAQVDQGGTNDAKRIAGTV